MYILEVLCEHHHKHMCLQHARAIVEEAMGQFESIISLLNLNHLHSSGEWLAALILALAISIT